MATADTPSPSTEVARTPRGGSGEMFDAIAHRYDLLNRLMSFGIDRRWRRKLCDALALPVGGRALDLATGTADVALTIAARHPSVSIVGTDPSTRMLAVGEHKVEAAGLGNRVRLAVGDAQAIEAEDDSFDGACISFGIRNVPDRARALAEMARVVKPGGRVAVLELSEPKGGLLGALARFHVHTLVPRMGALLSGAREYRYLQQSIAAFPSASEFAALMDGAGLEVLLVKPLTFGVAHLYVATPKKSQGAVR
jgi:demethylmenaquinone methyltransferase/2-methoxy-6-polyprenyl-1,4-benzoquinol methylase